MMLLRMSFGMSGIKTPVRILDTKGNNIHLNLAI